MAKRKAKGKNVIGTIFKILLVVVLLGGAGVGTYYLVTNFDTIKTTITGWFDKDKDEDKDPDEEMPGPDVDDPNPEFKLESYRKIDFTGNPTANSSLTDLTIVQYINSFTTTGESIVDSAENTQKVYKDKVEGVGVLKLGASSSVGTTTLNFKETYYYDSYRIKVRNYSSLNTSTELYSCDKGGLKVNEEVTMLTTNESDNTIIAPLITLNKTLPQDFNVLSLESVKRVTIETIELWDSDDNPPIPEEPNINEVELVNIVNESNFLTGIRGNTTSTTMETITTVKGFSQLKVGASYFLNCSFLYSGNETLEDVALRVRGGGLGNGSVITNDIQTGVRSLTSKPPKPALPITYYSLSFGFKMGDYSSISNDGDLSFQVRFDDNKIYFESLVFTISEIPVDYLTDEVTCAVESDSKAYKVKENFITAYDDKKIVPPSSFSNLTLSVEEESVVSI